MLKLSLTGYSSRHYKGTDTMEKQLKISIGEYTQQRSQRGQPGFS